MTRASARRRRAFILIEMVGLLALLAAFAIVTTELFILANRSQTNSLRHVALTARTDAGLASLRRDTWAASAASVNADGALILTIDNRPVRWTSTPLPPPTLPRQTAALTRTAPDRTATFSGLPPARFSVNGPLITLTLGSAPTAESLTLTGPLLQQGAAQ
jgi:hypothetical protein